uniref:Uncharacterized protein n=1 Tax=Oryza punctata TaxID=4537 RepID=A0A0E0KD69_ORYPU
MVPCGGDVLEHEKPLHVVCHSNQTLCLSVRDGAVLLARIDHRIRTQNHTIYLLALRAIASHQLLCLGKSAAYGGISLTRVYICLCSRQQWIVSFQNTGRVTDAEGHRSFALVNWSTGNAMKRSGDEEPAARTRWTWRCSGHAATTSARDFIAFAPVSDVGLVLGAAGGVPEFGGAQIIVFPWHGGANQRWCMLPLD